MQELQTPGAERLSPFGRLLVRKVRIEVQIQEEPFAAGNQDAHQTSDLRS